MADTNLTRIRALLAASNVPTTGDAWDDYATRFTHLTPGQQEEQIAHWQNRISHPRVADSGRLMSTHSPSNGPTMFHTNGGRRVMRKLDPVT